MTVLYLVLGALFGFVLSRSGAADYDYIQGMFLFQRFQLYGIIGVAVAVTIRWLIASAIPVGDWATSRSPSNAASNKPEIGKSKRKGESAADETRVWFNSLENVLDVTLRTKGGEQIPGFLDGLIQRLLTCVVGDARIHPVQRDPLHTQLGA